MKGGYRDGLKHQKGRNKGSLHSKDAQSYMTPSLYLCFEEMIFPLVYIGRAASFTLALGLVHNRPVATCHTARIAFAAGRDGEMRHIVILYSNVATNVFS